MIKKECVDYYKWEDNFVEGSKQYESLIKNIFSILNKGTMYTDLNDKFIGYISVIEGPLSVIHFVSDHSLDSDDYRFITIKVTYIDKEVLYFRIDCNSLIIYEFINGYWVNSVHMFGKI